MASLNIHHRTTASAAALKPVAAAASPPRQWLRPLAYLLLAGSSLGLGQCQPATTTEQDAAHTTPADSPKLETAEATPIPKFDTESPILRQLALLPPAERTIAPATMRRYQLLTRRFWLAHYSTDFLLKEAKTPPPNPPVFAQQMALMQGHWRVLREGINQTQGLPPTMADHIHRMQQVEEIQHAALSDLQADVTSQRPLGLDAANLAAQPQVAKLLAPLQRKPGPINVRVH
jgi:hypothetical protein